MRRVFPALPVLISALMLSAPACAQSHGGYHSSDTAQYDRGYREGLRDGERFQRGEQFRGLTRGRGPSASTRRGRPGYQDPAFARGYSGGYNKGRDDGRDRERYDPVRHGEYRSADDGYFREYGSKQAYENNYRTGFRQGYEAGYRDGTKRR